MKAAIRLACLGALAVAALTSACAHHGADGDVTSSDSDLTGSVSVGTYLVGTPPSNVTYVTRLTIAAARHYEADVVTASGATQLLAGSYEILPAHPNDPHSPIQTDKPTLVLSSDSGGGDLSFEFDKLPGGALQLYAAARQVSFTITKDPSWQPVATNAKVIACTGNAVNAVLTLDQAQNRRGTLALTRKASADNHDPPSVVVAMTKNEEPEVPGYIYFEGHHGEQDYYANMKEADFARGTGRLQVNLRWAQGGEEFDIGGSCAFSH